MKRFYLTAAITAAALALPLRFISVSPTLSASILENQAALFVYGVALYFVEINVFLFVFNLLPIPPLDGWKVLTGVVDPRTAYTLRGVEQYAIFLLIAVIFIGGPIIGLIGRTIFGILVGEPGY